MTEKEARALLHGKVEEFITNPHYTQLNLAQRGDTKALLKAFHAFLEWKLRNL